MQKNLKFFILSLVLITSTNFASANEDKISITVMTPSAIKSLLGDHPTTGSVLEKAELKQLIAIQDSRSTDDCAYADSQNSTGLTNLFASSNGPLTQKEAEKLETKTFKNYAQAGLNIYLAKKLYNRARPYDAHQEVKPCIELETTMSYPSGHAAIARYFANVLSEYFPERKAAFFKRASEIANNRVIGGVHYPSDIAAGIKLGDSLYKLFKEHEKNERD